MIIVKLRHKETVFRFPNSFLTDSDMPLRNVELDTDDIRILVLNYFVPDETEYTFALDDLLLDIMDVSEKERHTDKEAITYMHYQLMKTDVFKLFGMLLSIASCNQDDVWEVQYAKDK